MPVRRRLTRSATSTREELSPTEVEAQLREIVGEDSDVEITELGDSVLVDVSRQTRALLPDVADPRAFGVLNRTFGPASGHAALLRSGDV